MLIFIYILMVLIIEQFEPCGEEALRIIEIYAR